MSLKQDLEAKFQSLQQVASDWRSRVASLENENEQIIKLKLKENGVELTPISCNQDQDTRSINTNIGTYNNAGRKSQGETKELPSCPATIETMSKKRSKLHSCTFCNPMRCMKCDKRISMIPSVVSLLVKNEFLCLKDLGRLACVSPSLRQFICAGSDDDVWLHLLYKKWPSTSMMPQEVRQTLSDREWYQRLSCPKLWPGTQGGQDNSKNVYYESIDSRKEKYRRKMIRSKGAQKVMKRIRAPSLSPDDLLFLIDIFCDGKVFASTSVHGDALQTLFDWDDFKASANVPFAAMKTNPFKLKIVQHSFAPIAETCNESILVVRLIDYKVMSVFKREHLGRSRFENPPLSSKSTTDDLVKAEYKIQGDLMGYVPTKLTSRIGITDEPDTTLQGFCFELNPVEVHLPRSPYSFGHDYTVAKYKEYVKNKNLEENSTTFSAFVNELWGTDGASCKPELLAFFEQAEQSKCEDGNYYGEVRGLRLRVRPLFHHNDEYRGIYSFTHFGKYQTKDVTLLHLLEDLFEHNEKDLEPRYYSEDEYGDY